MTEIVPKIDSYLSDEVDYFKDSTLLFKYIESGEWESAISRTQDATNEASKWVSRLGNDGSVTWRRLPIHEACIRRGTNELINQLILTCPGGSQAPDSNDRLPIHHACFYGASHATILKLLLSFPESIDHKDTWGKTPQAISDGSSNPNRNEISLLFRKGVVYYIKAKFELAYQARLAAEKKEFEQELNIMKKLKEDEISMKEKLIVDVRYKLEDKVKNLEKKNWELVSVCDHLEKNVKHHIVIENEKAALVEDLRDEVCGLTKHVEQRDKTTESLHSHIVCFKDEMTLLKEKYRTKEIAVENFVDRNSQLNQQLKDSTSTIMSMKEEFRKKEDQSSAELSKLQVSHNDTLSQLKNSHDVDITRLKTLHAGEITSIKDTNNAVVTDLRVTHDSDMNTLKDTNKDSMTKLENSQKDVLTKLENSHKDVLTKLGTSYKKDMEKMHASQKGALSKLKSAHQDELYSVMLEKDSAFNAAALSHETQLNAKNSKIHELTESLSLNVTRLQDTTTCLECMTAKVDHINTKKSEYGEEVIALKKKVDDLSRSLAETTSQLGYATSSLDGEVARVLNLSSDKKDLDTANGLLEVRVASLTLKKDDLTQLLSESESKLANTSACLECATVNISRMSEDKRELLKEIVAFKETVDGLNRSLSEKDSQLENMSTTLNEEIKTLSCNMDILRNTNSSFEVKIAVLTESLSTCESREEDLRKSLEEETSISSTLAADNIKLADDVSSLTAANESLEDANESLKQNIHSLNTRIEDHSLYLLLSKAKFEEASVCLERRNSEIDLLTSEKADLSKNISVLEEQLTGLHQCISKHKKSLSDMSIVVDEERSRTARLLTDKENMEKTNSSLHEKLEDLTHSMSAMSKSLEDEISTTQRLAVKKDQLEKDNNSMQGQIVRAAALEKNVSTLSHTIRSLSARHDSLIDSISHQSQCMDTLAKEKNIMLRSITEEKISIAKAISSITLESDDVSISS